MLPLYNLLVSAGFGSHRVSKMLVTIQNLTPIIAAGMYPDSRVIRNPLSIMGVKECCLPEWLAVQLAG
jgi:hypothetical protein